MCSTFGAIRLTALSTVFLALYACGSNKAEHVRSQVVATVNDKEITVTQLNQALQAANVGDVTPELTKRAIDSLVTEEVLVPDALRSNLERDPGVVQAIEHARRQVLVQSFAERRLFGHAPPTQHEIETYYRKNPVLFSNRKLFRFTTFSAAQADITPPVREELNETHSVDQVRGVLDKHAIRYSTAVVSVYPEQLPIEKLPNFEHANVGDLLLTDEASSKELLMSLTGLEESPIALDQAIPMIRKYLVNLNHKEALEAYIKQTKASAKIAYSPELGLDAAVDRTAATGQPTKIGDASYSNHGYTGSN